ncbi:MAG: HD domain-containing protein [Candidatus Lernaella stagnicola]|nr:HD domain-containing protein [Candidatus Lernaella stagnicola]
MVETHVWLAEITDKQVVEDVYFLRSKSLGTTKSGKPYLMLTLSDRTGDIAGRLWDDAERFDAAAAPGDFVLVRARGGLWKDKVQLTVSYMEAVPLEGVDPAMFLPVCPRDVEPYWQTLREVAESLPEGPYRRLSLALLDDPEFGADLHRAPAATGVHQAYVGGLLEHTCSMLLLAGKVCDHFHTLDRSLLLAGVLFHDLGKTRELSYETALEYNDGGKLVGHLVFGVEMLEQLAARAGVDAPQEIMLLKHLILSHHGRPEFGTVRVPQFAEAAVLHYLDNLDARVFQFFQAEVETTQGQWSDRKWALETAVYKIPRAEYGYQFTLPLGEPAPKKKEEAATKKDMPLFGE